MAADGYLNFDTRIDTDGFEGDLKAIDSSVSKLTGGMKKLAGTVAAAFSTAAIIKFGKDSLEAAADVKAAASQMSQTFGEFENEASAAISRVADNADILDTRLNGVATSIYAFAKTSGMDSKSALAMMEDALTVAADSAAYYDRSLEDVSHTLQSFLKGNYENDAALGLSATETTRNAKAMEMYGKKFADLSESQKQLALLEMVKDANRLSGAMGQAAREADGWANVTGNLREAWRQLLGVVGQPILKLAVPVVQRMTSALTRMTETANAAWQALSRVFGWQDAQASAIQSAVKAQDDMTAAIEATEEAQEGSLASFDDIETLASDAAEAVKETGGGASAEALPAASVESVANAIDTSQIDLFEARIRELLAWINETMVPTLQKAFKLPEDSFKLPEGGITIPESGFKLPEGGVKIPEDTFIMPELKLAFPEGSFKLPEGATGGVNQLTLAYQNLNTILQPVQLSFQNLWNSLVPFETFSAQALYDFLNSFLFPVSVWTLGEGLPRLFDIIANGFMAVNWGNLNLSLDGLFASLAPFTINIGEGLLWLFENVFVPFGTWAMNDAAPAFLGLLTEAFKAFNMIYEIVKPGLEWIWTNWLQPIAEWTGGQIVQIINDFKQSFVDLQAVIQGDMSLTDMIKNMSDAEIIIMAIVAAVAAVAAGLAIYNAVAAIAAVVTAAISSPILIVVAAIAALIAIIVLCIKHWDEIKAAAVAAWEYIVNAIVGSAKTFYANVIEPIGNFFKQLWENIKTWAVNAWNAVINTFKNNNPQIVTAFNTILDVVKVFVGGFSGALNGIITTAKGIIEFITGVFTGDWSKAWEGVKTAFKGIWDTFAAIIQTPINAAIVIINRAIEGIVKGINSVISALNRISVTIPDWVPGLGGKHFGINIPSVKAYQIPMLATGAVIPPNREFLAVLGDQKQGMNIETPLATMIEAFKTALSEGGYGGDTTVILQLDGREFGRAVVKYGGQEEHRIGVKVTA